jgi:hypothetical protein
MVAHSRFLQLEFPQGPLFRLKRPSHAGNVSTMSSISLRDPAVLVVVGCRAVASVGLYYLPCHPGVA